MKSRTPSRFGFFGKLLLATSLAGGVLALAKLGEKRPEPVATRSAGTPNTVPDEIPHPAALRTPLILLPSQAALLLDADSSFFVGSPFTEEDGPCQKVRVPERVGLAVTKNLSGELSFWLSATHVEPDFAACAVSKVRARAEKRPHGTALPPSDDEIEAGIRWIRTPTGLLGLSQDGDLLFSTDVARKGDMARSLRREPSTAAKDSRVAWLLDQHQAKLRASLALPEGWMEGIAPDAKSSPLRHLRSATLLVMPSGESLARLQCAPGSCSPLQEFLEKLRQSIAQNVRPEWRAQVDRAASIELDSEGILIVHLSKTATDILKEELNESF